MNLEELRAEAAKLGYNLVKKQPYIKLSRCTCGENKPSEWFYYTEENKVMRIYKCDNCGLSALPAKTNRQARENWNQLISK